MARRFCVVPLLHGGAPIPGAESIFSSHCDAIFRPAAFRVDARSRLRAAAPSIRAPRYFQDVSCAGPGRVRELPKRAEKGFQLLPSLTDNLDLSDGCRRLAGKNLFVAPRSPLRSIERGKRRGDVVDGAGQLGLLLQNGGSGASIEQLRNLGNRFLSRRGEARQFSLRNKGYGSLKEAAGATSARPSRRHSPSKDGRLPTPYARRSGGDPERPSVQSHSLRAESHPSNQ